MKSPRLFAPLLVALVLSAVANAAEPQKPENGSFESGLDAWNSSGNVSIESEAPYAPTDGSKLVAFNAVNSTPNGWISQVVTVPNAMSRYHRLRFDVGNLGYIATEMKLLVEISEVGFGPPIPRIHDVITIPGITGGATRWQQASYDFPTPITGAVEIKLSDVSAGTTSADLVVDHLRIDDSAVLTVGTSEDSPYPGPYVNVYPASIEGTTNAPTPLRANYHAGDTVTLSAPGFLNLKPFLRWRKNGVDAGTNPVINLTLDGDTTMAALYDPPLNLQLSPTTEARSFTRTGPFSRVSWTANLGNESGATLEWSASTAVPDGSSDPVFLKVVPSHGLLAEDYNQSLRVFLTDEARGLAPGIHRCRVQIHSSFRTVSAEITLTVIDSEQYLRNAYFADGFSEWQTQGNVSLQSAAPYVPTFGANLVAFNAVNSTPNGTLTQVIPTEPGVTYQLSFDVGVLAYETGEQRLKVDLDYPSDTPSPFLSTTIHMGGVTDGQCHWDRRVVNFTAIGDLTRITFTDVSPVTESIDLLLDNVVVKNPYFNFMVTTLADENDPFPGMGSGDSLRETINRANNTPGSHHIYFHPAIEGLPVVLNGNELHTTTPIAINSWNSQTTIDAQGRSRVLNLGTNSLLHNIRIENGNSSSAADARNGGGILNSGSLMLSNCVIAYNNSPAIGAGVYSQGDLVATSCLIQANQSAGSGGGLHNNGNAWLESCIVEGNSAAANGGGLTCLGPFGAYWLVLSNSTISNNTGAGCGGGYAGISGYKISGNLFAQNTTFAGNQAYACGGAIHGNGQVTLHHATLSNNTATGPSSEGGGMGGGWLIAGNSIISGNIAATHPDLASDISGYNFTEFAPNLIGGDASLSSLGNHGGPTPTMVPGPGSPALDAASDWSDVATDQRGYPRISGIAADLGAVELKQLVVDTLADEDDGVGTGGVSLRDAVAANKNSPVELIRFAPPLSGGTIHLSHGPVIAFDGPSTNLDASNLPGGITVSGDHVSYVFGFVFNAGSLRGLTVVDSAGYAVDVFIGGVDFVDCKFRNNQGAISVGHAYNGVANINRCLFENNHTDGDGGAIFNYATVHVMDSTFVNNHAGGSGGAIACSTYRYGLSVTNSTFTGNTAANGAAIQTDCLTLIHSTLVENQASVSGGGILSTFGTPSSIDTPELGIRLTNNIIAANTAPSYPDIAGSVQEQSGANLIGGAPMLAPLACYDSATPTRPPLPGSPAIDGAILLPDTPAHDQRGAARPNGAYPDIGAVEAFPFSSLPLSDSDDDGIDDRLEPAYGFTVGADDGQQDSDGDGSDNATEIANMTDPFDASSLLRVLSFTKAPGFDAVTNPVFDVTFSSFPGLSYSIQCDQNLDFSSPAARILSLGTAGDSTQSVRITLAPNRDFMRVRRDP